MGAFMDTVVERFCGTYERTPVNLTSLELAERAGIEVIPAVAAGPPV